MSSSSARIYTAIALLAVFTAGATRTAAQQPTPTLGELAKKEQERRKALKEGGKVLTKEDLPAASPAPAPPAGAAATPPASSAAATTTVKTTGEQKPAPKPEEEKGEAWWRQRMTQARDDLRRNEMFAEALQTRINALTTDFTSRDDPYQRARIGEDRQKAMAELDRVRSEIELQKKKIGEIEEEARRASVPPGWLR
jgi:cell division septation protein DedD